MKNFIATVLVVGFLLSTPHMAFAAVKPGLIPGDFFYFVDVWFDRIGIALSFSNEKRQERVKNFIAEREAELEELQADTPEYAQATALIKEISVTSTSTDTKISEEEHEEDSPKSTDDTLTTQGEKLASDVTSEPVRKTTKTTDTVVNNPPTRVTSTKEQQEATDESKSEESSSKAGIVTLPSGAVVQLDDDGIIIKILQPAPDVTSTKSEDTEAPVNAENTTTDSGEATKPQISSVSTFPTRTTLTIEWQTDVVTESKVFLNAPSMPTQVLKSQSGNSKRHVVKFTNLTEGTQYNYEIEAVADSQTSTRTGQVATTPDEYTIGVTPDKTSVRASGYDSVVIRVVLYKNGEALSTTESVSMESPDPSQDMTRTTNSIEAGVRGASFWYSPKTEGSHQLTFTWKNTSQSLTVNATPFTFEEPVITLHKTDILPDSTNDTVVYATIDANDEVYEMRKLTFNLNSSAFSSEDFKAIATRGGTLYGTVGTLAPIYTNSGSRVEEQSAGGKVQLNESGAAKSGQATFTVSVELVHMQTGEKHTAESGSMTVTIE